MAFLTIDSHHHFWDPETGDYPWMQGPFAPIRKPFGPDDLRVELNANSVDGTVLVQTWSSADETVDFLEMAASVDFVKGVVGWVDLTDPHVSQTLAELKARETGKWLVGIRHQVHDEADPDWLLRDDVRRGLSAVEQHGLVFDLLIRPRELAVALQTVSAFPNLRFVIDHIAKPDIKRRQDTGWEDGIGRFAPHKNHVWCKLSGMTTEADWTTWRPDNLQRYITKVLDVFGPTRCMFGTDWPVCLLASDYRAVKAALEHCLAYLNDGDRQRIFGGNAIEAYRLPGLWTGLR